MSLMNILVSLTRAVGATAVLPVDVVADVVTLGGTVNDKPGKGTYTGDRAKVIMEALDDATETR